MKAEQNGSYNNNNNAIKQVLRKGPWMPEEDEILIQYVRQYGARDWNSIGAKGLLPRTGKSCRLRWVNKLKPDLKSGCKFSPEEERMVMEMQATLGNKWAKIASYLPGRTDNDVKNFWSTRQKRMMRALQSSKVHSTDNIALTDFSNFQHQMKSSAQPSTMHGNAFETPICTFAEEAVDPFKDPSMEFRKVRQKTMHFTNDVGNSLMVKLQDLVASDSTLYMEQQQPGVVDDSSEGSTVSSALINDVNNNYRSCKPDAKRTRQGTSSKREMSTSNLEFTQLQNQGAVMEDQLQISSTHNICDFEVDLYIDANDNNILDFLLQPEEDVTSSTQISSSNDQQQQPRNQNPDITDNKICTNDWEKMQFTPGNIPTSDRAVKEEFESYTPTSILQTGFPVDVFEALEPLSPTTSIWWDSQWSL